MKEITDADSDVVDVAYKAMNGEIRVMPWTDVDPVAVADGRPWREFPWYLGQRHYSGMYWSATEAKLVGYESLLELSRLLMADFDRSSKRIVVSVATPNVRTVRFMLTHRREREHQRRSLDTVRERFNVRCGPVV